MNNSLSKNKILIATPMLPPSLGGPAIHAVKLFEYFTNKNKDINEKELLNSNNNSLTQSNLGKDKLIANKKKSKNIDVEMFCFEKLNKYPAGIRHILALNQIFKMSKGKNMIFALDGFSVALPAVIVGKLLNKKVFLRIGGDLVHEQYVESYPIDMERFYNEIKSRKLKLNFKLKILWLNK
jgi:hypothetical protein